ncbi:hypothetical protein T484DRAFT_1971500 [Baffinella frigidus]|nr:hypothetical protein T484DRAFT_1971500 [Cryptophyta sp. CCMP2293]
MASNPDVIISGMLGPPDAFALLCHGGAPPARQKRGRTLGVGMTQGGEQRPRAERAAAAGEPSASVARRDPCPGPRAPRPNAAEKARSACTIRESSTMAVAPPKDALVVAPATELRAPTRARPPHPEDFVKQKSLCNDTRL